MASDGEHVVLDAALLTTVAQVWRQQGRILETSFGGTSMLPAITPLDVVRFHCGAPFATGDVIIYVREERVVVHRVIRQTGEAVWTRGDANLLPDPPISRAQILGRVSAIRTGEGWREVASAKATFMSRLLSRIPPVVISLLWQARWLATRALLAARKPRPGAGS